MIPKVDFTRQLPKIVIDNNGGLCLTRYRAGKEHLIEQGCNQSLELRCGDWCPHFSEPIGVDEFYLSLCNGTVLTAPLLIDDRKKVESAIIYNPTSLSLDPLK